MQGDYALTDAWSIHLPEPFARRIEDGALASWSPGLTLWLIAWNNDNFQPQSRRLASITEAASASRFSEHIHRRPCHRRHPIHPVRGVGPAEVYGKSLGRRMQTSTSGLQRRHDT